MYIFAQMSQDLRSNNRFASQFNTFFDCLIPKWAWCFAISFSQEIFSQKRCGEKWGEVMDLKWTYA